MNIKDLQTLCIELTSVSIRRIDMLGRYTFPSYPWGKFLSSIMFW